MDRPLRVVGLLFAIAAVSAAVFGAGGFTEASADRSVAVAVVDNEDAYLALTDTVYCENETATATINNQLATELQTVTYRVALEDDGTINVTSGGDSVVLSSETNNTTVELTQENVGVGEQIDLRFHPDNGAKVPSQVSVTIVNATGEGITVAGASETVALQCATNYSG